jgi:zinc transport system ATP-binding protein
MDASNYAETPLISLSGIGVRVGHEDILTGIDLTVSSGEIVTVIGPNGAGKTTLIRVALALVKPDRGTVERREGLRIGYMPQSLSIDRTLPLTVERLLRLGAGTPQEDIERTLETVGVAGARRKQVHDLSGGELRRALLARALLRRPQLLVLDEPAQGVDVVGQADLYNLIGEMRDEYGCGVLMVSHDLNLVMSATDHVICINHHLCCAGQPEAVGRDPAFTALFGDRVAGALALYHHEHDHDHGLAGEVVEDDRQGHRHG